MPLRVSPPLGPMNHGLSAAPGSFLKSVQQSSEQKARLYFLASAPSPMVSMTILALAGSMGLPSIGQTALLDLGLRLGEASGAALAIPIVRAALACHRGMATFAEAAVSGRG